jgi:hypothetical protein
VFIRLLCLVFIRPCGWLVLLSRPAASKDIKLLVVRPRSPYCTAPSSGHGQTGPTAVLATLIRRHPNTSIVGLHLCGVLDGLASDAYSAFPRGWPQLPHR